MIEFDTLNNSMVPSVDVEFNVNDEVDVDIVGVDTHVSLLKVSSEAKFLAKQKFPLALENIGEFGWQT